MADTMRTLTDEQINLIRDTLQDHAELVTDEELTAHLLALASLIEGLDDGDATLRHPAHPRARDRTRPAGQDARRCPGRR